jgi:hypothetical protein
MPNAGGLEIYRVWQKPTLLVLEYNHDKTDTYSEAT